jgi:hypothetical protein
MQIIHLYEDVTDSECHRFIHSWLMILTLFFSGAV